MSNLQKIVVLCVVGGIILVGGFFLFNEKEADDEVADTLGLRTYRSEELGFEVKYPKDLTYISTGPNYVQEQIERGETISGTVQPSFDTVTLSDQNNEAVLSIEVFYPTEKLLLKENYPDSYPSLSGPCDLRVDFNPSTIEEETLSGEPILIVRGSFMNTPPERERSLICVYLKNETGNLIVMSSEDFSLLDQILSTFRRIEDIEDKEVVLPTICKDELEGTPVITSISPTSGPIGTEVEIRGCNLAGFEGDLDAVFVRSDGVKIFLYGGIWHPTYGYTEEERGKLMRVTVQSNCESGYETGRYSGITAACEIIEATPGLYKVYVAAWTKTSNEVNFTVQQSTPSISITSPTSETVWDVGSIHTIIWDSVGVEEVRITTASGGKNLGDSFLIDAVVGMYAIYGVPDLSGFGVEPPYELKVRVYSSKDSGLYDEVTYTVESSATIGEEIIKKVGEIEGSFLIQKINPDTVEGIQNYSSDESIAVPYFPISMTLHIGDDIGAICAGISKKLTSIDFAGQTVTFTKVVGQPWIVGCPVCLAGGTLIATPLGAVLVTDLEIGMSVWTIDTSGDRVSGIVQETLKVPVPTTHQMVHLVLEDGRELFVSPGHAIVDGRTVGELIVNDFYDGARVITADRIAYNDVATYDILPSGETGFYWANGILLDSTLH